MAKKSDVAEAYMELTAFLEHVNAGKPLQGGLFIGDGAIAAVGAAVAKDIPENAIVGGIPARVTEIVEKEEQT